MNNLLKYEIQFQTRLHNTSEIFVGQVVFITCAPQNKFTVWKIIGNTVYVTPLNVFINYFISTPVPCEAILPYKYRALIVQRGFDVCLN